MSDLSPNICFDALSVLNSNVQLVEKGKPSDQQEPECTVGFTRSSRAPSEKSPISVVAAAAVLHSRLLVQEG